MTLPPRQRRGEKLTPEQLLPTESWRSDPKVKSWLRAIGPRDGKFRPLKTAYRSADGEENFRVGESAWFTLPEHTALHQVLAGEHEVSLDVIKEQAVQVWKRSGRRHLRFRALLLYWYPDNPNYRGALVRVTVTERGGGTKVEERDLSKLAQTWKPFWSLWTTGSTEAGVAQAIDTAFYRENQQGVSPASQSEERIVYFVAYEFYTYDNVTPPSEGSHIDFDQPVRAID